MTRTLLAAFCAAAALPAHASGFGFGGNSGALARQFALPPLGNPTIAAPGHTESQFTLDFMNEFVREGLCDAECVVLDGETARLRVDYRQGMGQGWDFTMSAPLLSTGGGFLDGSIEQWHDWFNLPNGGREQVPRKEYHYQYQRDGATLLDVTESEVCLGDVNLGLGTKLGDQTALRMLAKLPTADADLLCGGNLGGAAWLDIALSLPRGWDGYFAAGASYNERGEVLPALQNRVVYFGGVGVLAPLGATVRLHLEVQAHSRLYHDSELTPMAKMGVPLTIGLQFGGQRGGSFEVGFQEDPVLNSSPDFVAYMAATYR
jgi:hypothetical protein